MGTLFAVVFIQGLPRLGELDPGFDGTFWQEHEQTVLLLKSSTLFGQK